MVVMCGINEVLVLCVILYVLAVTELLLVLYLVVPLEKMATGRSVVQLLWLHYAGVSAPAAPSICGRSPHCILCCCCRRSGTFVIAGHAGRTGFENKSKERMLMLKRVIEGWNARPAAPAT